MTMVKCSQTLSMQPMPSQLWDIWSAQWLSSGWQEMGLKCGISHKMWEIWQP